MARFEATGVLLKRADGHAARVRIDANTRPVLPLHPSLSEDEAQERCNALATMAARLRKAGMALDAPEALKMAAAAMPGVEWVNATNMVDALCGGQAKDLPSEIPTVKVFAKDWSEGKLHDKWPDHVRFKASSNRDDQLFRTHINDPIGNVRMDRFCLKHAESVMAGLPSELADATRRQVAQAMRRLAQMAVYPARYLEQNPIPKGWLPTVHDKRAKSYVYPSEDRALLACGAVLLRDRLVYGFLAREGCRKSEALTLCWRDIEFSGNGDNASLNLDANKTREPRSWSLDPGVVRALQTWKDRYRPDAEPTDLVFSDDGGHVDIELEFKPEALRKALHAAGVNRPALFEDTDKRQPIRLHDLRATFITTALANGKTESWVADRTGHTTSKMINEYRRKARNHEELNRGTLTALDAAIRELQPEWGDPPADPPLDTPLDSSGCPGAELNRRHADFQGQGPDRQKPLEAEKPSKTSNGTHPDRPVTTDCVQSRVQFQAPNDPIMGALAAALQVAAGVGDALTVGRIVEMMHARELAAAGVIDLGAERAKRT